MRMHYSQQVTMFVRSLGEDGTVLRRALESLKTRPAPEGARPLPERAGGYEWLIEGYWVMYEVDRSNPSETVLRVVMVEAS